MAPVEPPVAERARALHRESVVVDGLQAAPMTPEHFARLRRGGIRVVNYTAVRVTSDFAAAALDIAAFLRTVRAHADQVLVVRTGRDIDRAVADDRIGLVIGMQNGKPVMDSPEYVGLLHLLGVRIIQLTYNDRNLLGDGCVERANGGLSRLGRRVVEAMNRHGVLVDLSHCGEQTTLDAIEASRAPVAVTHSMARALCPSPRNKPDAVLRALAANGGVMGAAFWAPMAYRTPDRRPTMDDFFAHVDHLVQQAGVDHVGIGSDLGEGESREYYEAMFTRGGGLYPEVTAALGAWYDFDHRMVEGMETATMFPRVTEGLAARGYSDADIRKIMGGNFLRVFRQVFDAGPAEALLPA
jgi:membrane dipeptidase